MISFRVSPSFSLIGVATPPSWSASSFPASLSDSPRARNNIHRIASGKERIGTPVIIAKFISTQYFRRTSRANHVRFFSSSRASSAVFCFHPSSAMKCTTSLMPPAAMTRLIICPKLHAFSPGAILFLLRVSSRLITPNVTLITALNGLCALGVGLSRTLSPDWASPGGDVFAPWPPVPPFLVLGGADGGVSMAL